MMTSVRKQKKKTAYCCKYTDRPFCLKANELQMALFKLHLLLFILKSKYNHSMFVGQSPDYLYEGANLGV